MDDKDLSLPEILQSLLDAISYTSPREMMAAGGSSTDALISAMNAKAREWALDEKDIPALESTSKKAAAVMEFFYYHLPFETKLAFGFYVWFFFYIDDFSSQESLVKYQHNVLVGAPQSPGPISHFQSVLADLYTYYDPLCANFMVCSAMEFISGCIMEGREEVLCMEINPNATAWPKYLRLKTGMAPGFSAALFPRATNPDITAYMQAFPEIDEYMVLINDIMSFYKEELAGETMNYTDVRAKVAGKHPRRVLADMAHEAGDIHRRIVKLLEGSPAALKAYMTVAHGEIAFHFALPRYKLSDLGFTSA
ncbi:isoprenoid synthase domain-containing protein [Mycena rosella]|uniref:Isoprenoid synthase domain-containing protein n=1 Tax=Mycena rosella TaxID=1033263 RepID=A0AAD7DTI8_MYCRO|nr:isoprenoid synthase domain-containing protein [Mycena rosella]